MMTSITMENINTKQELKKKTAKPLLWIGLVSIVMFFAGLTSAVIVSKTSSSWISFIVPNSFLISTIVILFSSITFHWALLSAKKNKINFVKTGVVFTFILAVLFVISQFLGWSNLVSQGVVAAGEGSSPSGSYFYALTVLHLLHLIGGIISLLVVMFKSFKNKYNSKNTLGIEVSLTYWHFLGALWVYLYFFLFYIAQ